MNERKRLLLGAAIVLMLFFIGMIAGIEICLVNSRPVVAVFIGIGNTGLVLIWMVLVKNFPKKEE